MGATWRLDKLCCVSSLLEVGMACRQGISVLAEKVNFLKLA